METMIQRLLLVVVVLLLPTAAMAENQIKQIEINGLEYSDARTVERELPFAVGDVWKDEYGEIASRRLRNLGLFSEAVVLAPDDQGIVHIRVNDRWPLWLLPEATRKDNGASSAGLTMTHHNLWGLHHNLRLAVRGDTGDNFSSITSNNGISYQGSYAWRRIGDTNFGFDASFDRGGAIFDAYQNGVLTSSYFQDKQSWSSGVSYGLGPVPGEGWDVRLGFAVNETAYALKSGPLLPDVLGLRRQAIQASTSYRLVNDRITWFTGNEFDYNLSVAHQAIGSTINSYRQTTSLRRHIEIGRQNTLDYRINAGLLTGNILRDGLFDVGDSSGMRGYYSGDLQGNPYVYGTLVVRHPSEINSNDQLVAFVVAGHVRLEGRNALDKPIVIGVGGGVRWTLRWLVNGTLRADMAYGVATRKWRLHLGTGQAF
ncbi:MAG: hypothetical protein K9M17_02920 [Mariprofundaceae bacterium]|nr:hypothetical protein [Mariprofundaceae bacterium]